MCLRHVALPLLTALTLLCAAPSSGRPAQQPRLKATTELVRVDALVLDRQGRVVADLTAEDFEVWQDGQQQQVTTVAFVQPNRVASPRPALSTGASAPQLADAPAPTVYRTVAIVVDDLGLSFTSIDPAQRALADSSTSSGSPATWLRSSAPVSRKARFSNTARRRSAARRGGRHPLESERPGARQRATFDRAGSHRAAETTAGGPSVEVWAGRLARPHARGVRRAWHVRRSAGRGGWRRLAARPKVRRADLRRRAALRR